MNLVARNMNTVLLVAAQYEGSGLTWEMHVHHMESHLSALISAGASVNAVGYNGVTPLMHICRYQVGHGASLVNILLDAGANINAADGDGMTALMHAADHNHYSVVAALVSRGADVNRRNHEGDVVAEFLTLDVEVNSAIILMRAGADISHLDMQDRPQLRAAMVEWKQRGLQLQHKCREVIRCCVMARHPGIDIQVLVAKLKLPQSIIDYLADADRFVDLPSDD